MFMPLFPVLDPLSLAALSDSLTGLISGEAREGTTITGNLTGLSGGETITYKWQEDTGGGFVDISGETGSSITINIGTNVTDGATLRRVPRVDGQDVFSNTAPMRYAPGVAPGVADQEWTLGTEATVDASASGANLTFTYTQIGLPAGGSINASTGLITVTASSTGSGAVTVTPADQYGRIYPDTFDWSAAVRAITFTGGTYTRGSVGVAPTFNIADIAASGITGGTYMLYVATRDAADGTLSKTDISTGSGDALDTFSFGPEADILDLAPFVMDLSNSLTADALDWYFSHSGGTESNVGSETGVTYDAVAPAFTSAVVEDADPDAVVITLSKDAYDPSGDIDASDFAVTGFTVSTATLTNATTITLGLSADVADTDDLTGDLSFTGDYLVGIDAEVMGTFASQNITNNVVAPGGAGFTDDFTANADGTPLVGNGYTAVGARQATEELEKVTGDRAQLDTAATGERYVVNETDIGTTDHFVEAVARCTTTSNASRIYLIAGSTGTGADGYYRAQFNSAGSCFLVSTTGGGDVSLDTGTWTVTTGADQTFRMEWDETAETLSVLVDGVEVMSATGVTTYTGGERVGFGSRLAGGTSVGDNYFVSLEGGAL